VDHGYPTPRVRLFGGPGPDLDRSWMVMDLAPGRPLLADLSGVRAVVGLPRLARALPDRLTYHAAALHRVDPTAVRLDRGVDETLARLADQTSAIDRPDLASIAEWLHQHKPVAGRVAVCHGDLHPFNILTDPSGDTVPDWSSAHLAGRVLARRFSGAYDKAADQPVDPAKLSWFTHFHALRVLTEVATWFAADEADDHGSHPFRSMTKTLSESLSQATKITVGDVGGINHG
jgi:aminoglycoside phosphotransferase (APT) family kinase protein